MLGRITSWTAAVFAVLIGIIAFVGVLLMLRAVSVELWSEEAAGWAQAIGSVVAIGVAFKIGARQGKDAISAISFGHQYEANRRYAAYSVIAEAARKQSAICLEIFKPHGFHLMTVMIADVVKSGDSVSKAVQAIPIHEVGSYEAVDALLALKTNLDYLGIAVGAAVKHLDSFGSSPPFFVTYDCTFIHLNADQIQKRATEFIVAMGQTVRP